MYVFFYTIQHHHSIYIQTVYNNHEDFNMKFTLPKQKLLLVPLVFKTLFFSGYNQTKSEKDIMRSDRTLCKLNKYSDLKKNKRITVNPDFYRQLIPYTHVLLCV